MAGYYANLGWLLQGALAMVSGVAAIVSGYLPGINASKLVG